MCIWWWIFWQIGNLIFYYNYIWMCLFENWKTVRFVTQQGFLFTIKRHFQAPLKSSIPLFEISVLSSPNRIANRCNIYFLFHLFIERNANKLTGFFHSLSLAIFVQLVIVITKDKKTKRTRIHFHLFVILKDIFVLLHVCKNRRQISSILIGIYENRNIALL